MFEWGTGVVHNAMTSSTRIYLVALFSWHAPVAAVELRQACNVIRD